MKKQILILLLSALSLFAIESQHVHSSASIYYEMKDFSNSVQKNDGVIYGVSADIHHKDSMLRAAYEKGATNTIQPPLSENLSTDKLYLRYGHILNEQFSLNVNYINILSDNIAPTDQGVAYGAGLTYTPNKAVAANFTQYYTDYKEFDVYQSDFKIDYKTSYKELKYKLTALGKYITFKDKDSNSFSTKAQDDYTTVGLKIHSHYKTYHLGAGAFFGKRAFAIMNDGFKIQHHAMEFDRTYAVGIGKSFGDVVLRYQFVYQRATELPMSNENVEITNNRVILNYKF